MEMEKWRNGNEEDNAKSITKNYNSNKSHRAFGGGTRGRSVGDICVVVVVMVVMVNSNSSNWKAKAQSSTQQND